MHERCVDSTVPEGSKKLVALDMSQGYLPPRYLEGMK